MRLNIRQLIEHLSLNIDDIILEVFKKDIIDLEFVSPALPSNLNSNIRLSI